MRTLSVAHGIGLERKFGQVVERLFNTLRFGKIGDELPVGGSRRAEVFSGLPRARQILCCAFTNPTGFACVAIEPGKLLLGSGIVTELVTAKGRKVHRLCSTGDIRLIAFKVLSERFFCALKTVFSELEPRELVIRL